MKALQVYNGDLSLDSGGKLQFLQGSSKLVQDLGLWLQEPYGTSFTAPSFGSTLYSMVGGEVNGVTSALIETEIRRVVGLYQSQQLLTLQTAQNTSQLANYNKSEIINVVNSIQLSQSQTAIYAYVTITTLANSTLTLNLSITPNGIRIV